MGVYQNVQGQNKYNSIIISHYREFATEFVTDK